MKETDTLLNWGFRPSTYTTGWILYAESNMFWDDMRGRDLTPSYIGLHKITDAKETIIEAILGEFHEWFYERDGWDYVVEHNAITFPFHITLNNGKDTKIIELPDRLNFYIPAWEMMTMEEIEEILQENETRTTIQGREYKVMHGNWFRNALRPYLEGELKNINKDIDWYITSQDRLDYKSQLRVLMMDQHDDWERRLYSITVAKISD